MEQPAPAIEGFWNMTSSPDKSTLALTILCPPPQIRKGSSLTGDGLKRERQSIECIVTLVNCQHVTSLGWIMARSPLLHCVHNSSSGKTPADSPTCCPHKLVERAMILRPSWEPDGWVPLRSWCRPDGLKPALDQTRSPRHLTRRPIFNHSFSS